MTSPLLWRMHTALVIPEIKVSEMSALALKSWRNGPAHVLPPTIFASPLFAGADEATANGDAAAEARGLGGGSAGWRLRRWVGWSGAVGAAPPLFCSAVWKMRCMAVQQLLRLIVVAVSRRSS